MTGRKKLRELKKAGIVYYEISDDQGKILEFQLIKFRIAKALYGLSKTITQHNIPCAWDSDVLSKFERISDQSDKLFYTITVLNDFDKSIKIDIPYSLSKDMVSQNLRETLVEFDTIRLKNCNFRCEVHFPEITRNTEFRSTVFFSNVFISGRDKEFNVNSKSNRKSLNFYNCRFSKYLKVKDYIGFDLGIFKKSLIESLSFADTSFLGNLRIKESKIVESDFYNTSFYELADFYCTEFYYPTKFHQTDFFKVAIFSNVHFQKEVQFLYCKVEPSTYISFENATFSKALDISRANFICTVNYWSIYGLLEIMPINIQPLLDCDLYRYDSFRSKKKDRKNDRQLIFYFRESIRIIKDSFKSRNDKISYLSYQKLEMDVYNLELQKEGKFRDKIIIFLNQVSNEHGTNPLLGIGFTIYVGFSFFFIHYYTCFNIYHFMGREFPLNFLKSFDNLIDYMSVINFQLDDLYYFKNNPIEKIWLIVGKFFLGFGYYQTIAAFRKFLKN